MKYPVEYAADVAAASGNGSGEHAEVAGIGSGASGSTARGFQRILIVRLGSMGDIIHSLPAVSALRSAFPQARIDWVVEERWAELLCSQAELRAAPRSPEKPLVDEVLVVDTRAWRRALLARRTRAAIASLVRRMSAAHYEVAIDLQSAVKSALVAKASRTPLRFGFRHPIESPAGLFYNRHVEALGRHMVEQNVSLVQAAISAAGGIPQQCFEFPLPQDAQHDVWAARELSQRGIVEFVVISPGAGWGAKCWPADRFAEVARALASDGLRSLVNYGPGEEALARSVVEQSKGAADAISCSIGQLIALARRARLLVGGDTGPTHLAAALAVPVVGIHGPTDPARNGPFGPGPLSTGQQSAGTNIEVLRSETSTTSHTRHPHPEVGLLSVTAAEVVAVARKLLQRTQSEARR